MLCRIMLFQRRLTPPARPQEFHSFERRENHPDPVKAPTGAASTILSSTDCCQADAAIL